MSKLKGILMVSFVLSLIILWLWSLNYLIISISNSTTMQNAYGKLNRWLEE